MSDWQLDRLPGDVRQEAENAAQRDGLPLHRWLGKLISDTCAEEGVPPGRELLRPVVGDRALFDASRPPTTSRPMVEPIRLHTEFRAADTSRAAERPAPIRRDMGTGTDYRRLADDDAPIAPRITRPAAPTLGPIEPRFAEAPRPVETPRAPHFSDRPPMPEAPRLADAPRPPEPRPALQPSALQPVVPPRAPAAPAALREPMVTPPASAPAAPPRVTATPHWPSPIPPQSTGGPAPPPSPISSRFTSEPAAPPFPISTRFTSDPLTAPARGAPPTASNPPTPTTSRFAAPTRAEPKLSVTPPSPSPATSPASSETPPVNERLQALGKLVLSLRRNELSPIGEARLFLKLMTEHLASIADITAATGRSQDQVSRSLRLLGLSDRLRDLIDRGALSREQAFALLDTDDPESVNPVVPPNGGARAP